MGFFQNWLIPLLENYGLLIVFLTMVAESACIPIPSEIVVPYGGFLAAQGHTHLWAVIVVATVANLVGSSIAYAVGRYGGRALFVKYGRYVLVSPHHLDRADRVLHPHDAGSAHLYLFACGDSKNAGG
jgi:membrane protein DedA with SNARE-associated domain